MNKNLNNENNNLNTQPAQPVQPTQPTEETQSIENLQIVDNDESDFKNIKSNKLIIFIIILIILLIISGVILFFVLNKSKDPKSIFIESIAEVKKQFNSFTETFDDEVDTVNNDKIILNNDVTFDTNTNDLAMLKDLKLNFLYELDYQNKYFNMATILGDNDKQIADLIIYLSNNALFFESENLFSKVVKIQDANFDELLQDDDENLKENTEDIKYLVNNLLDFTADSLVEDNFIQEKETITINNENIDVTSNIYNINQEIANTMKKSIIEKILNDEKFIEILTKYSEMTVEKVKDMLNEEKNKDFAFISDNTYLSIGKSEASMIYSGVGSYCALSSLKKEIGTFTSDDVDCENKTSFTEEEISKMVNLGNAKVVKLSYTNKINELIVESNGYIFTLQSDGTFKEEKQINDELNITFKIYTKGNDFIGLDVSDDNSNITYTDYKDVIDFVIKDEGNDKIIIKNENDITNITFNDNDMVYKATFNNGTTKELSLNINDELNINVNIQTEKISDNEQNIKTNIELNSASDIEMDLKINIDSTIYTNKDIEIKKTNSYIELDELTENDIQEIMENLYKNAEGTFLEDILNLFLGINNPDPNLDIY